MFFVVFFWWLLSNHPLVLSQITSGDTPRSRSPSSSLLHLKNHSPTPAYPPLPSVPSPSSFRRGTTCLFLPLIPPSPLQASPKQPNNHRQNNPATASPEQPATLPTTTTQRHQPFILSQSVVRNQTLLRLIHSNCMFLVSKSISQVDLILCHGFSYFKTFIGVLLIWWICWYCDCVCEHLGICS